MHMIAGIVEHDLDLFARATNRVQDLGFKWVELDLQHKGIPALRKVMLETGASYAGMSSFGPTLFAIGDSDLNSVHRAVKEYMELLVVATLSLPVERIRVLLSVAWEPDSMAGCNRFMNDNLSLF